jgi:hypothetical protein
MSKKLQFKVYEDNGSTFLGVLTNVMNEPTYPAEMNGGYGECVLNLNIAPDEIGESLIDYMRIVKIYIFDENYPSGKCIYTGFISQYSPYIRGAEQGLRVSLLGLVSLLAFDFYKDGSAFTVAHSADDPAVIIKAIIDHANSVFPHSVLTYDTGGTSVSTVGTNVTYTFEDDKWLGAMENAVNQAGDGWWWLVDHVGEVWLQDKPATATHAFTIGKDIELFDGEKTTEEIINSTQVRYDGGTEDDTDSTSIAAYWQRGSIISDDRIKNSATAVSRATTEVDGKKDPAKNLRLVVNSNYNLESIKPGDTCKIKNWKLGDELFGDNMQIVSLNYSLDRVELELEASRRSFGKEIEKLI